MQLFSSLLDLLNPLAQGVGDTIAQYVFFQEIFKYLDSEIDTFRHNVIGNLLELVAGLALVLTAIWIFFKGWMIVSGRSRDSMMGLVVDSLRATLIVFAASTMAFGATTIYGYISNTLPSGINEMVTGEYELPARNIDDALAGMQAAMVAIDAIPTLANSSNKADKDRAVFLTGLGAAGPSVVGGALMLMYKMAIALFVGFGPLFILCLLFKFTEQLFSKWLFYGIGTMFAMAVLNFMVTVAMKILVVVTGVFAAQAAISAMTGGTGPSVSSLALQQGGLGMLLTVMLITIPPMAASFFNGVLGQFSAYSQFGLGGGQQNPAVVGPGAAAPRNMGAEGTPRSNTQGAFDAGYSPNPGAQVTGSGAGSTIAQPDEIKKK